MKKFIIKMKNKQLQEYKIHNKNFLTFPEAVSYAYDQRAKLGNQWELISVARLQDVG